MSTERPSRGDYFARNLASTSQNRKINNTIALVDGDLVSIESWLFLVAVLLSIAEVEPAELSWRLTFALPRLDPRLDLLYLVSRLGRVRARPRRPTLY